MKQVLHQVRDKLGFFPGRGISCILSSHLSTTNSRSKSQLNAFASTLRDAKKKRRQICTTTNFPLSFSNLYPNNCLFRGQYHRTIVTNDDLIKSRPFKVLGLQQIAVGSLEKDKSLLRHLWIDILGIPKVGSFRSTNENVDEDILCLGPRLNTATEKGESNSFSVEIDLMSPLDPNIRPKVHIPPLNHIGLWVDDLPAAVQWMKSKGVRFAPGGIRKGASGHDVTFIHPKGNEESPIGGVGVLIELVQAPAHVIASHDVHNDKNDRDD